jgi:hypothetical protein
MGQAETMALFDAPTALRLKQLGAPPARRAHAPSKSGYALFLQDILVDREVDVALAD